jgi:hypothetical protein
MKKNIVPVSEKIKYGKKKFPRNKIRQKNNGKIGKGGGF